MEKLSKPQMCSGLQAQLLFSNRVDADLLAALHQRLMDYLNSEEFVTGLNGANRIYASVNFGEFDLTETTERLRAELTKI